MITKYSTKFYLGIVFIITSLIIGKITTILTITYWSEAFIRNISILLYILSWPLLILGAYWTGQEYVDKMRQYSSTTFYKEKVKKHAKIAYAKSNDLRNKVKNTKTKIQGKVKATHHKIRTTMNQTRTKFKGKIQLLQTNNKK